jgi:hypothetical protein
MKWPSGLLFVYLLFTGLLVLPNKASTQAFVALKTSGGGCAMGQIRASLRGKEALFSQIAGLSSIESGVAGLSTKNHYLLPEINQGSMALAFKTNSNLWIYGRLDYLKHFDWLQQQFSLGIGRKLTENLALGLSLHYQMATMPTYGNILSFNADVSLQYNFNPTLSLGMVMHNFLPVTRGVNPKVSPYSEIGLRCVLSDKTELYASYSIEIDFGSSLHAGIRYQASQDLTLKTGFFSEPGGFTLGLQYTPYPNITAEIQTVYHLLLGNSPSALLIYHW